MGQGPEESRRMAAVEEGDENGEEKDAEAVSEASKPMTSFTQASGMSVDGSVSSAAPGGGESRCPFSRYLLTCAENTAAWEGPR